MRAVVGKAHPASPVALRGTPWVVVVGRVYVVGREFERGMPLVHRLAPERRALSARRTYFPTHADALAYAIAATSGRAEG